MRKRFTISLNIPVSIEVIGDDASGEVDIIDVCNVWPPSICDIRDSMTDGAIAAIDEAFAKAEPEK